MTHQWAKNNKQRKIATNEENVEQHIGLGRQNKSSKFGHIHATLKLHTFIPHGIHQDNI